MACRIEMIAMHVHGEDADLDEFFEAVDTAVQQVADEADKRWPGIEFMPPVEGAFEDDDEDE